MARSVKSQMTPKPFKAQQLDKSKGIFDDYAVRKNVATREGTIEKVPVNSNDIVNKAYADAHTHSLDEIENPGANKTFTMSNKTLAFRYTAPTPAGDFAGAFEVSATGGFSGNLVHIHQHTGNPGAVVLLDLESDDADVIDLNINSAGKAIVIEAGTVTLTPQTASEILALDGSKNIQTLAVATYPSLTELSYVKGLTSAAQTQITANTTHAADNSQAHTDYLINTGVDVAVGPLTTTADNSSADQEYIPNVLYNTDDTPPAANTVPIGTIYVQYTA